MDIFQRPSLYRTWYEELGTRKITYERQSRVQTTRTFVMKKREKMGKKCTSFGQPTHASSCGKLTWNSLHWYYVIVLFGIWRDAASQSKTHSAQKVSGLISNWNLKSYDIKTWVCLREGKFSKFCRVLLYFRDSHKNMDQIPESESTQSNSEYAFPFQVKEEIVSSDEESGEISQPPQKTETSKVAFKRLLLLSS